MLTSNHVLYSLVPFLALLQPIAADTCSQVKELSASQIINPLSIEYFNQQVSPRYKVAATMESRPL
jgi:hypothetical protein